MKMTKNDLCKYVESLKEYQIEKTEEENLPRRNGCET